MAADRDFLSSDLDVHFYLVALAFLMPRVSALLHDCWPPIVGVTISSACPLKGRGVATFDCKRERWAKVNAYSGVILHAEQAGVLRV